MNRFFGLALILAVVVSGYAHADYYDGLNAFKAGDYERAMDEWQPLADEGFVEAQYQLARMYHRGYAVQDDALALKWYGRAARQGHPRAQNNLGVLYEQGRGIERDDAEAAEWYRKAAQQGLTVARANLGLLYDEGRGIAEDPRQAARWYRLAADSGHVLSQYRLARLFSDGRGVAQSYGNAAGWYRKAGKAGHGESQLMLATMYDQGLGVKKDLTKAAKWGRLAAMQGLSSESPSPSVEESAEMAPDEVAEADEHDDAALAVAAVAASAPKPPPPADPPPAEGGDNLTPALAHDLDAAEAGDVDAAYELARRYATGDGAPISHQEAGKWYLAAAEGGHDLAGYKIAFQYFRGRGIAKSKELARAHFWFTISAERGVGDAAEWRDKLVKKMNKSQRAESDALLAEWKRTHG